MWLVATISDSSGFDLREHTNGADRQELPKDRLTQPIRESPLFGSQIARFLSFPEEEI